MPIFVPMCSEGHNGISERRSVGSGNLLWLQLVIGSAIIILTVLIHASGIAGIVILLQRRNQTATGSNVGLVLLMRLVFITLALFLLHVAEIWVWAALSANVGETLAVLGITVGRWKVKCCGSREISDDIERASWPLAWG